MHVCLGHHIISISGKQIVTKSYKTPKNKTRKCIWANQMLINNDCTGVHSVLLLGSWGLNNPSRPLASILIDWRSP